MRTMFFLTFIIVAFRHFSTYDERLEHSTGPSMEVQYFVRIYMVEDAEDEIAYYYAFGSFLMWVDLLYRFRLTRYFGPLIKMISQMLQDISVFLLLYVMQLVVFACVAHILFPEIDSYSSVYKGVKTLFDSSLGSYSFVTLEGNQRSDLLGDFFLIFFLFVNHILLINLLIAILSSTYAYYETQGVSLYVAGILQMRSAAEYDNRYGALVSSFPPWNVVLLPVIPAYMLMKDTKKLNKVIFHITFLPVLLISFGLFILLNLVLVPFAYFKCIASRVYQLGVSSPNTTLGTRQA